ncbi:MAG TPA: pilus assembly protein PilV [Burkholderiaceae bacterium]|nr:pilus assembly protein PilV [Burkholderiaceae bacterium]
MSHIRPCSGQRGIALIEALIGILIFAFGVLGLIGLQASMTKAQSNAKFRADAANLASDLFGLIQTDAPTNGSQYLTARCASYARCADWQAKVAATLPGGTGTVALATGTTTRYQVVVAWKNGGDAGNKYMSELEWNP